MSDYEARVRNLESLLTQLANRLLSDEQAIAGLQQQAWQQAAGGSQGPPLANIQIASGSGIAAGSGGDWASATGYTFQKLNPSTGALTANGSIPLVWNGSQTGAVASGVVIVGQDIAGNWLVITEFC